MHGQWTINPTRLRHQRPVRPDSTPSRRRRPVRPRAARHHPARTAAPILWLPGVAAPGPFRVLPGTAER